MEIRQWLADPSSPLIRLSIRRQEKGVCTLTLSSADASDIRNGGNSYSRNVRVLGKNKTNEV